MNIVRPLLLVGCPAALAATGLRGAGRRSSRVGRRATGRREDRVRRPLENQSPALRSVCGSRAGELAGRGEEGDVSLEALAELAVVGVGRTLGNCRGSSARVRGDMHSGPSQAPTGSWHLAGSARGTPIPSASDAVARNIFVALATRQQEDLGKNPSFPRRDHVSATPSWAPLCAGPPTHQNEILVGPRSNVRA